jgi:hypothetical protein
MLDRTKMAAVIVARQPRHGGLPAREEDRAHPHLRVRTRLPTSPARATP